MDFSWLIPIIKQAPALIVMAFVVVKFLQHLEKRDAVLINMGASCHQVQREGIQCMNEVKEVMGGTKEALSQVNNLLIKMNGK